MLAGHGASGPLVAGPLVAEARRAGLADLLHDGLASGDFKVLPPDLLTNLFLAPISYLLKVEIIGRRWTDDEVALIEAVSEQMSLAIENARLFDDTQQRATREKVIADMTGQVWASGELEQVMKTAVEQLGVILDASKVTIRLGTEDQLLASSSPGTKG